MASTKTKKIRRGLFRARVLSFAVSVFPLLIYFLLNFGYYVKSISDGFKLSVGFIVIAVILVFTALGKLKVPSRLTGAVTFCGVCWLLRPILADLLVISSVYLGSVAADEIIFARIVKRKERALLVSETADEVKGI